MTKTVGFEVWETITMSLPNLVRCKACETINNYAGIPPESCVMCGANMTELVTDPRCNVGPGGQGHVTSCGCTLRPRTGTPVTDAYREMIKDPKKAQEIADAGNALAAGLRAVSQSSEDLTASQAMASEGSPLPTPTPKSTYLSFDDFCKVDLRVGTVATAEAIPKSKKMLKLSVNFGEEAPRQILAGVGLTFKPEDLVGKQYVFVTNLAPREVMKGLWSHGMILAAGEPDALSLTAPSGSVAAGTKLQ